MPVIRINNVRCQSLNTSLIRVAYCNLKPIRRDFKEFSVRMNALKKPVKRVMVNIEFVKRTNGYKAFMPVLKVDACTFLKKRNNYILNSMMVVLERSSNLNHTCPYDHDLIIEKLNFKDGDFPWIPFASGDYGILAKFILNDMDAMKIEIFVNIVNK